jgi:hypothetical protein
MSLRQSYTLQTRLDGTGGGFAEFTARGDVFVQHTNTLVAPVAPATTSNLIPSAIVTINGVFLEGSGSGNLDASDTAHLMEAGDVLRCTWAGGDPGATATCIVRGLQYPAGQGMAAVSGAVR